ncbi:MAG: radical SAM protein [Clostridia bacterium]|nr:radical SAM protein [Clostridia bacterium]
MAHCEKKCLTILLTEKCNLRCKYCYCDDGKMNSKSIDFEFIKCAVDDFVKEGNPLFVRYFGNGEPTIEFKKIKETTEYCKSIDPNATFELQTNGVFNDDILKWIGENINIVWVSYDGTTEINDFYRRSKDDKAVSHIVEKNIRYLNDKVDTLGVRATIGRANLYRQREIIDKMQELGVRYLYSDLIFASVENQQYYEEEIEPMEYAKEFLEARSYSKEKNIYYGSFFTINFDKKINIFCRACIPMPHLTTDGYVSCCDMGYSGGKSKSLIYGKYSSQSKMIEYDQKKIDYIRNRRVDNLDECKNCKIKYYCAGGCIGEAMNENGSIYRIKRKNCEAIKYLAKNILHENEVIPVLHP